MQETVKRLRSKADKLYQITVKKLKPYSVVSGEPTEVIHHYIPKSQSNNLRYDIKNGIPLTNAEHCRHHRSGDPSIVATAVKKYGAEWDDDLQARRRIIRKINKGYLQEVISELQEM